MKNKGLFVTFEGGEGSGKSSVVKKLYDHFNNIRPTFMTKDPGGTDIADQIRSILLDSKNKNIEKITELFLYHASRCELVRKNIYPAHQEGKLVLCDRFFDSTWVYQGYLRGWSDDVLKNLDLLTNSINGQFIKPDLTFLCDVDAKVGLSRSLKNNDKRVESNGKDESRWEKEGLQVHERINAAFRSRAIRESNRFYTLNSNIMTIEEMAREAEIMINLFFQK